jgi:flavin reductase
MSWIDQRPDDAMEGAFFYEAFGRVPFTVESKTFREAMSRLGAAVHVVTTDGARGRTGFTATSVVSVSDQPATLLVCLNRRSQCMPPMCENGVFCVNTLAAEEEFIADIFAGRTGLTQQERFRHGRWKTLKTGAPVLESAIVAFDCRVLEIKTVATHNVFFGAVEAIHEGPAGTALVYHEREYKRV